MFRIKCFLFIFITFRRLAWNRKHINIKRTSKGWLQSIYGDRKLVTKSLINRENNSIIHHDHDNYNHNNVLMPLFRLGSGDRLHRPVTGAHTNIGNDNIIGSTNNRNNVSCSNNDRWHTSLNLPITTRISSHRNNPEVIRSNQTNSLPPPRLHDIVINTNDPSPRRPASETERILGTSFDFSNIPSNIQATIAEVGYKLSDVLLISDEDIRENRGNDAYQYILFQQYIIYFLTILTIFCMLVILPINLKFGTSSLEDFVSTTIMNFKDEDQSLYWVHVSGAPILSLIGIYLMNRFTRRIQLDDEQIIRRTLLIRRVPKSKCNRDILEGYFKRAIPDCTIDGIQSLHNVRSLLPIANELTNLVNARCYCVEYLELKGRRLQIRPSRFGEFGCMCGCCKCCRRVDGIKYYSEKEEEMQTLIERELSRSIENPTGGFFITFRTEKMAQKAFIYLKQKQERAFSFCPFPELFAQISTWIKRLFNLPLVDELQVSRWIVSYAPYPDDINWCDITVDFRSQWIRSIILNLLLLIIFVFFSTPTVILQNAEKLKSIDFAWFKRFLPAEQKLPDLISPLILIIAASALPAIVTLACQYIAYVNLSGKNHAIMWKVYLFLILMVIIWPPLGTTSIGATMIYDSTIGTARKINWECLFPANVNVGAFFVNYTIQSAFIGNIMELLRFPELLVYLYYRVTARSKAEVDTASRYVVWDFGIGIRYPRFLLIFAMVVTYSLSCPLISVAGLVYMIIKHFIDRYNIYYVYNPSKINSKIHSTAIIFVHIAFLMMQAQLFILISVRTGYSRVCGVSMFIFIVSLLIFSGHFFFYMFRNINHLTYRATRKQPETNRNYCACSYLPPILYALKSAEAQDCVCLISNQNQDEGQQQQQQQQE